MPEELIYRGYYNIVVKNKDFQVNLGCKIQFYYFLAMWTDSNYLTSLSFSFFISKRGVIQLPHSAALKIKYENVCYLQFIINHITR